MSFKPHKLLKPLTSFFQSVQGRSKGLSDFFLHIDHSSSLGRFEMAELIGSDHGRPIFD